MNSPAQMLPSQLGPLPTLQAVFGPLLPTKTGCPKNNPTVQARAACMPHASSQPPAGCVFSCLCLHMPTCLYGPGVACSGAVRFGKLEGRPGCWGLHAGWVESTTMMMMIHHLMT